MSDTSAGPVGTMPGGKQQCGRCHRIVAKRYLRHVPALRTAVCGWCYRGLHPSVRQAGPSA